MLTNLQTNPRYAIVRDRNGKPQTEVEILDAKETSK